MTTDKEKDKNFELWLEALAKGVLLGGSLGLIAGWIGLLPMERGLFLGFWWAAWRASASRICANASDPSRR